jgi:hypothetical protein
MSADEVRALIRYHCNCISQRCAEPVVDKPALIDLIQRVKKLIEDLPTPEPPS